MSNTDPSQDDFPLPIPKVDNAPVAWTAEAIAELSKLPPQELNKHVVRLLAWYVKEDDVFFGQKGNEYWEAGHHMAKALLAAQAQQSSPIDQAVLSPVTP